MLAGLVAVVVVVLVVAGVVLTVRRSSGDEVHSVQGYRNTLDTLEHVRSRTSAVRVLPRAGGADAADAGAGGAVPAAGAGTDLGTASATDPTTGAGDGRAGYQFGDRDPDPLLPEPSPFLRDTPRQRRKAMAAMNHGPRRIVAPIVAGVLVLGAVVALAVVGAHTRHSPSGAATTTTTHPHHSASGQHTTTTGGHNGHATSPGHSSTTTTAPASFSPQAATATTASYVPPSNSYVVKITTTSGACWVQVTSQPSGTVELSQTMPAGSAQAVNLTGGSTLELGAPGSAAVTVDGTPVVLPTGYGTPFTMTFTPPAAGA